MSAVTRALLRARRVFVWARRKFECCGRDVYFRELSCSAQGHEHCVVEGETLRVGEAAGKPAVRLSGRRARARSGAVREKPFKRNSTKSPRRERLLEKRERELDLLRERVARHAASKNFIARSEAMQEVLELAGRVAPIDTTVLV